MPIVDDRDILGSDPEVCRHATAWIASFFESLDSRPDPDVGLRCHRLADFPDPQPERQPPCCLFGRGEKGKLVLHLCRERLADMPLPAVQAALDLELAMFTLERHRDTFAFNFQKKIRPSLSVSGTAVHLIRKMVWHLEKALRLQAATRMVLDLGRGHPQVVYYFHTLNRSPRDSRDYERMHRRDWVRGLYLCRKCDAYFSIFLLQQAGLSSELVSFWEQCNPFLLPHDRQLLERLAREALADPALSFADRIVRMFGLVRAHLSI